MKTKTAIAIITKNRIKELENCLISIKKQTTLPDEIIVIDNDGKSSAKKIVSKEIFKKLRITYKQKKGSVPKCRNFALKLSTEKYLGFVDDDCILNKNWLKNGLQEIKKKRLIYVSGQTELLNKKNVFALAQHSRDSYWNKHDKKTFDTKNVLIDLQKIKEKKLNFDEKCQSDAYDSADFDFDFKISKLKLDGSICKTMVVFHKETSNYQRFVKRAFHRGKLANYLNKKWQLNDRLIDKKNNIFVLWLLKTIKNFHKEYVQYEKEMYSQAFIEKLLSTFFIKVYERYYTIGYMSNEKNN